MPAAMEAATQMILDLCGGEASEGSFGSAVALAADGNTALIGSPIAQRASAPGSSET